MSIGPSVRPGLIALLVVSFAGCVNPANPTNEPDVLPLAMSTGPWTIYQDPWVGTPMAGTPNPITSSMAGSAWAVEADGKMKLTLSVSGLPPNRSFGSHLHKLECDDAMKAGGHYENQMWPAGGTASDPQYSNPGNEVWLDFTTDADGKAWSYATVDWVPRPGGAKAIIIHANPTSSYPQGGIAGVKLACLPLAF